MINEQWVESFGRTSSASNKSQWSCEPHDPQQLNMGFIVTLLLAMVKTFVFRFMQFENAICKAHVDVLLSPYIWPTFQCPTYMRVFMITALLVLLMMIITMFISIIDNDCDYEDDVGRKREAEGELRSNVWSVNSATARCCWHDDNGDHWNMYTFFMMILMME